MGKTKGASGVLRGAKSKVVKPAVKAAKRAAPAKVSSTKAMKPAKATRPSLPLPPPPPPPPTIRDELIATRDIARLLRYGEQFGPRRIDVRMLPLQLAVSSNALAIFDPVNPKSWRVLDRPSGSGQFRVMLSLAKDDKTERLAAVIIHVGRPPIAKWSVAHFENHKKPSPDALPRCTSSTGWIALVDSRGGPPPAIALPLSAGVTPVECPLADGRRALAFPCGKGEFATYWAVDEADKPICLVVDFDVFTQKDWKAKPTT